MLGGLVGIVLGACVFFFVLKAPRVKRTVRVVPPIPTQPSVVVRAATVPMPIQLKHITALSCPDCGAEVTGEHFATTSNGIPGAAPYFVERDGERSEGRRFLCGAALYWDATAGRDSAVRPWNRCRNSDAAKLQREKRIAFKAAFEKFLAEADVDKDCIDSIKHHVHIWID